MTGIKYLLSDLDGVIRHFPPERDQEIEKKFGLSDGTLISAAFEKSLLTQAITGQISDEFWRNEITEVIAKTYPHNLAIQAVKDWSSFPGKVDYQYLECFEVMFPGLPVAILTNGTSRLPQDMKALGIADRFFKIFNSAEIGFCKPDKKVFVHVIEALSCKPSEVLFIDDSLSHVNAAKELGMVVHHYQSIEGLQKFRNLAIQ